MKKVMSTKDKVIRGGFGLLLGAMILAASLISLGTIRNQDEFMSTKLQKNWTVQIGEDRYEDVDLENFTPEKKINRGTKVSISNTLPNNLREGMTLRTLIYLSCVEVYIDNDCIYTYGMEEYSRGDLVGSGHHVITLPDDCAGKEVTIIYLAAEDEAFTNIPAPSIIPTEYAVTSFANATMPQLYVGVFLFVTGMLISIVAGFARFFKDTYDRLFIVGILSLLVGAWAMCNGKVLQTFAVELSHESLTEYACLYLAPIALMTLIIKMNKTDNIFKKLSLWIPYFSMIFFNIIAALLQYTNICHYPRDLKVFHVLCLFLVVCALYASAKKFTLMDDSEKVLNIAIIVLCVFGGIDVIRFNISKYFFPNITILQDTILPYGMLIFILLLLVSYLLYIYSVIEEKTKNYMLKKMAYNDSLTGLYNRAKSDEIFEELSSEKKGYYLVNIDVNGLKAINDTYGHAKGDILIVQFASILRSAFGGIGTIVRMGGDEFLIVVDEINATQIKPALRRMIELESIKSGQLGFPVEASFGVATNKENSHYNPEQVYSLADSRMYEMKQRSKNSRKKHT